MKNQGEEDKNSSSEAAESPRPAQGSGLLPLATDDPTTDGDNNKLIMGCYDKIDDPTKFLTRSFVVLWNEGHSVRLINREGRGALSIPWDEIRALIACLSGTRPVASAGRGDINVTQEE